MEYKVRAHIGLDDDRDSAFDADPSARTLVSPHGLALVDDLLIVNDSDPFRFVAYRRR